MGSNNTEFLGTRKDEFKLCHKYRYVVKGLYHTFAGEYPNSRPTITIVLHYGYKLNTTGARMGSYGFYLCPFDSYADAYAALDALLQSVYN